MSTPLAAFGPGILIVTRTDIANAPPVNVGYAQEFSMDSTATNKPLYGQKKFPLVVAQSTVKATGKIKAATLSGLAWNNIFYGQSFSGGGFKWNVDEAGTVPADTAYTITVANAADFDIDLGVRYTIGNLPLQRVAAGPTAGQYTVADGVYTFAAADASKAVKITYSSDVETGQSLIVMNSDIGDTPSFQLDYYTNLNQPTSKPFAVRLFACVGNKITLAATLEDYIMPAMEFDMFADDSDRIYQYVFPEVS